MAERPATATRYVLTLDLGSSGLRACAVPAEQPWLIASEAARRYRVLGPRGGGLGARFAPNELRAAIVDALGEAASAAGTASVVALSVTAQRGGTAFLGSDGETIYVGPNTDLRAVFEGAAIDEAHGEQVYATTGHLPSMFFTPAKLRWWRTHHPRVAARIAAVATLGAWAVHELTGVLAETPSQLVEAGLGDVTRRGPATALLAELDVPAGLLPALVQVGTPTGHLRPEIASQVGLPAAMPVYLAGPDAQTAALGAGCVEPGDTVVVAGWSAPVQRVTSAAKLDPRRRTWAGLHPASDRWVVEANPGDTGRTLDVVRRMLGARMSISRFDRLAASAPERTAEVMALWGPRVLDLSNPGMSLGGLLIPTPVTYDGIDAATVARATLENIAFAIRECVALVNEVAPGPAGPIALTGGMAASETFAAMLANTLGRPVRRHPPRASASGAAIVAGLPRDAWAQAGTEAATHAEAVEPDPSAALAAAERYERWLRLRAKLDALADDL